MPQSCQRLQVQLVNRSLSVCVQPCQPRYNPSKRHLRPEPARGDCRPREFCENDLISGVLHPHRAGAEQQVRGVRLLRDRQSSPGPSGPGWQRQVAEIKISLPSNDHIRWWQSPSLQYGPAYQTVTLTINLGQLYQVSQTQNIVQVCLQVVKGTLDVISK